MNHTRNEEQTRSVTTDLPNHRSSSSRRLSRRYSVHGRGIGLYDYQPRMVGHSFSPCCGCLQLQKACYIIGILGAVSAVLLFSFGVWFTADPQNVADNLEENTSFEDIKHQGIFGIAIAIVDMASSICLIVGASNKNRSLCKTSIWIIVFGIGCTIVNVIIAVATSNSWISGTWIFGVIFYLVVLMYFITVVAYYIKELNVNGQEQMPPDPEIDDANQSEVQGQWGGLTPYNMDPPPLYRKSSRKSRSWKPSSDEDDEDKKLNLQNINPNGIGGYYPAFSNAQV